MRRYLAVQLAGDRREALRLLVDEGLLRGIPFQDIHLKIIQPAQYEIGRLWRVASDFLEMAGFGVRFLGANVPTSHLVRMVREQTPDLLALSVTMTYHLPALRTALDEVHAAAPRLPIAVGGLAFTWVPGLEKELNVNFHGRDARELAALACRTLGV